MQVGDPCVNFISQVIQALGTAIYKALDFGLSESEEPHLSPDLECLIESLTDPDQPADDDEGIDIERYSDDQDGQGKEQSVFQDIIDVSTCNTLLYCGLWQQFKNPIPSTSGQRF